MEKYCYKCLGSIEANDEYLHCFKCDSKVCLNCININSFNFNEDTLLYDYNCNHCIKISSL